MRQGRQGGKNGRTVKPEEALIWLIGKMEMRQGLQNGKTGNGKTGCGPNMAVVVNALGALGW